MHTTAIKQEAMNIRQRAEERAERFMKFISKVLLIETPKTLNQDKA